MKISLISDRDGHLPESCSRQGGKQSAGSTSPVKHVKYFLFRFKFLHSTFRHTTNQQVNFEKTALTPPQLEYWTEEENIKLPEHKATYLSSFFQNKHPYNETVFGSDSQKHQIYIHFFRKTWR